jgi:hypothetical protein
LLYATSNGSTGSTTAASSKRNRLLAAVVESGDDLGQEELETRVRALRSANLVVSLSVPRLLRVV